MAADAQTWHGWEKAILHALGAPNTPHNRTFLEEWAATEPHKCTWNPLGATLAATHSRNCKHLAGHVYIQAYATHSVAVAATVKQLREATYQAIVACLHSGDPFKYGDWQTVVGELGTWGAHRFAKEYSDAMSAPVGGGIGGAPASAGGALKGYHHLAKTLGRSAPKALYAVHKQNRKTLARLHGRR